VAGKQYISLLVGNGGTIAPISELTSSEIYCYPTTL